MMENSLVCIEGGAPRSQTVKMLTRAEKPIQTRASNLSPHSFYGKNGNIIINRPFKTDYKDLSSEESAQKINGLSGFDALKAFSSISKLNKQDMLIRESDKATNFYEILFGHIQTYTLLSDGRRLVTKFYRKGDFLELPYEDYYSYSAQALTRTDVRCYSNSQMNYWMEKFPDIAYKIIDILQKQMTYANDHMVLLGRKSPIEKVASFLMSCDHWQVSKQDADVVLDMPMSLTDIADHLGLTKETVCRTIGKLKHLGVVKSRMPHQLYVHDLKALHYFTQLDV